MTLARARIIKSVFVDSRDTPRADRLARRISREVMDAKKEAERIVADARTRATEARAEAAREAREQEIARVAAELLAVRDAEEKRAEREIDRTIEVAVLLAERLVGEALKVEPERIAALAHEALRETRGARRVKIEASPDDVKPLTSVLTEVSISADVVANADLARGSLVVHTDLGRVDARLSPVLSRLAEALREAMK